MIENVKFNGSNDILIEYDFNGKHKNILFSELEAYWSSATEELFEAIKPLEEKMFAWDCSISSADDLAESFSD